MKTPADEADGVFILADYEYFFAIKRIVRKL
jgi:hypothetical protein